jgi:uncharacterized membrane protein YfcA
MFAADSTPRRCAAGFAWGASVGVFGGLIGLGGAELRLPILIGIFQFAALEAVILNKAMSLVVIASALPFRAQTIPLQVVAEHWMVIANLLAGSIFGAWFGAGWVTRLKSETLYRVIAVMLVLIAGVLLFGHAPASNSHALLAGGMLVAAGAATGFAIGVVAALLGVAGGNC